MRRKLEAMDLQRWVADNLVVVERKRCLEQRAPDFTKIVAGLHREGRVLTTPSLLRCADIPTKESFSTEDTARLGGRDASSLARRCWRWGPRVEGGQWIRGRRTRGMRPWPIEGWQRPACVASTSSGRSRGQGRARGRGLGTSTSGVISGGDDTRPFFVDNMAPTSARGVAATTIVIAMVFQGMRAVLFSIAGRCQR